jgi:hypothetical protein
VTGPQGPDEARVPERRLRERSDALRRQALKPAAWAAVQKATPSPRSLWSPRSWLSPQPTLEEREERRQAWRFLMAPRMYTHGRSSSQQEPDSSNSGEPGSSRSREASWSRALRSDASEVSQPGPAAGEQVVGEEVSEQSGRTPSDRSRSRKGKAPFVVTPPPGLALPEVSHQQGPGAEQREASSSHAHESSSDRLSRIAAREAQLKAKREQEAAERSPGLENEGP